MLLASIKKEKASSCKLCLDKWALVLESSANACDLKLCGKCLTSEAWASSCSFGLFQEFCSKGQRAQAFPAQPTHIWKRCKAHISFVLCVTEEVSRPCSWVIEWFKNLNLTTAFHASIASVSTFLRQLAPGKMLSLDWRMFLSGLCSLKRKKDDDDDDKPIYLCA